MRNWGNILRKVKVLVNGYHKGCKIIQDAYWTEVFPHQAVSLKLHFYPNGKWQKEWRQLHHQKNYLTFVHEKLLSQKYNLSDINVMYFTDKELRNFQVNIDKGFLYKNSKLLVDKNYIFVLKPNHEFYIGNKIEMTFGKIQHSSFTRGGPVKSAGWIKFDQQGNVIEIANFSGHYRPAAEQVMNILQFLYAKSVNLSQLSIVFSPSWNSRKFS